MVLEGNISRALAQVNPPPFQVCDMQEAAHSARSSQQENHCKSKDLCDDDNANPVQKETVQEKTDMPLQESLDLT